MQHLSGRWARFLHSQRVDFMKYSLLALCPALLLASCADVRITHTDVATGATNPSAIYIKPFDVSDCTFIGKNTSNGERAIKESLAPAVFADDLKEELEQIAPALVLKPGDYPTSGWLVEGSLDRVDAGHPGERGASLIGALHHGASHIMIHVRVIDLDLERIHEQDAKDSGVTIAVATDSTDVANSVTTTTVTTGTSAVATSGTTGATAAAAGTDVTASATPAPVTHIFKRKKGVVIYEFDMAGGSKATGALGSITAPGLGYAPMFDYRNAAERVYEALDPDEFKFGLRDSPTIR